MAASAPVIWIERAHKLYREGMHDEALALYSEALSVARSKAQRIALHSNRAACYLKLREFKKAAEECSSVLELDQEHTGALMLRVQILVTLKDYQSALFDVNRLTEIDPSSDVYANLHARLKTQLSLAPIPEADEEAFTHDREREETEEKEETEERKKENELLTNPSKKPSQMSPESKVPWRTRNPESQSTQIQKAEKISESKNASNSAAEHSKTLEKAAKLKGHYGLDYSRWDNVDADSSENDEDEDEDEEPRYRFRIRTL